MRYSYNEDGKWWVSPYNREPSVIEKTVPKHKVEIHDATLRDGEQTPGVVFSAEDKLRIAEKLIAAGVTRLECGMPAVSESDQLAIQMITREFPQANTYAFARANRNDIDMARDCGVKGVVIEIPIGRPKLEYQFRWNWEQVLEKSANCITYARSQGLKTVYFPYDTTRADADDLTNLLSGIMNKAKPDSVGLVDTMGCALPETIQFLVRYIKKLTDGLPVEVHTHNDFGMAVITELAGMSAGANVLHSCVNGLGERTGNAALEELIQAMIILYGMETPYDLIKLGEACQFVSKLSGIPLSNNKPFSGAGNYTRESGIGVDLVVKKPLAMFATDPAIFGRSGEVVLGKKSGKLSIVYYLERMGKEATDEQIAEILARVKALGAEKRQLLSQSEFEEIVAKVL